MNNDTALLATYDAFFSAVGMSIGELTPDVIERATEIRATYGFKTPDALHLASAIEEKADVFITGDSKLAMCKEIRVEVV
jgi:predicted nucleic acid-binding protein